jgi:hypothetical protein
MILRDTRKNLPLQNRPNPLLLVKMLLEERHYLIPNSHRTFYPPLWRTKGKNIIIPFSRLKTSMEITGVSVTILNPSSSGPLKDGGINALKEGP